MSLFKARRHSLSLPHLSSSRRLSSMLTHIQTAEEHTYTWRTHQYCTLIMLPASPCITYCLQYSLGTVLSYTIYSIYRIEQKKVCMILQRILSFASECCVKTTNAHCVTVQTDWLICRNFDMNTQFRITHLMVGEPYLCRCSALRGVSRWYGQHPSSATVTGLLLGFYTSILAGQNHYHSSHS